MKLINNTLNIYFISLFLIGCGDSVSSSVKPENGILSGKVTFTNTENWPSTGSIAISLSKNWPPQGAPAAFIPINFSDLSNSIYTYSFETAEIDSTYESIAISWSDPNDPDPATNQHILGAYGGTLNQGFMDATSLTPTENNFQLTDLNFIADVGLIEETQIIENGAISGTITFSGTWPNGAVFISLNSKWPLQTTPDYYSIISSESIINNQYNYNFENVAFNEYTIAVLTTGNPSWITLGAYGSETSPDFEDAIKIVLSENQYEYNNLNFNVLIED